MTNEPFTPPQGMAVATGRVLVVLNALEAGASRKGACAAAELTEQWLWKWMKRSTAFKEQVERAEAKAETNYLARIVAEVKNPKGQWTAAAWALERLMPERYGRRERVDIRVSLEQVAGEIAKARGLDLAEVLAEAEAIVAGR